jgi:hypothetical protein
LAGKKLVRLSSQSERSAVAILQANGGYTRDLTYILVGMGAKNNTYRMRAGEILENICSNYTNDDEYLKSLKQTLLDAVPKVTFVSFSTQKLKAPFILFSLHHTQARRSL